MNVDNCCANPPPPCEVPVCPKPIYKYVQPAIRESCKPHIEYQRPCIPLESCTTYKTSYLCIDPQEAAACRMCPAVPPIKPISNREVKMENLTVTRLSYPGHSACCRQGPIVPNPRTMLGEGPMQDLTTHRHDYVPKPICRRPLLKPPGKIIQTNAPLEHLTINRLSFPQPANFSPSPSCKPDISYVKPCIPMETATTHKMSFMPVCIPQKECLPWKVKAKFCMPCLPMDLKTTNIMSYPPPGEFIQIGDGHCPCPATGGQEQVFPRACDF